MVLKQFQSKTSFFLSGVFAYCFTFLGILGFCLSLGREHFLLFGSLSIPFCFCFCFWWAVDLLYCRFLFASLVLGSLSFHFGVIVWFALVIGVMAAMEERYEPLKELGSGNFGVARLVRDKTTKELVAVKYIERGKKVIFFKNFLIENYVLRFCKIVAAKLCFCNYSKFLLG